METTLIRSEEVFTKTLQGKAAKWIKPGHARVDNSLMARARATNLKSFHPKLQRKLIPMLLLLENTKLLVRDPPEPSHKSGGQVGNFTTQMTDNLHKVTFAVCKATLHIVALTCIPRSPASINKYERILVNYEEDLDIFL